MADAKMTGQDPSKVGCYLTAGNCHIIYLGSGPFTSENLSAHSTPYRLTSAGARAHLMHDFSSTTNIDFLLSTNRHICNDQRGFVGRSPGGVLSGFSRGGNAPEVLIGREETRSRDVTFQRRNDEKPMISGLAADYSHSSGLRRCRQQLGRALVDTDNALIFQAHA